MFGLGGSKDTDQKLEALEREVSKLMQHLEDIEEALVRIAHQIDNVERMLGGGTASEHKPVAGARRHVEVRPKELQSGGRNMSNRRTQTEGQDKARDIAEFVQAYNANNLTGQKLSLSPTEEVVNRLQNAKDNEALLREMENIRTSRGSMELFEAQGDGSGSYMAYYLGDYDAKPSCYLLAPATDQYIGYQDMIDKIFAVFFEVDRNSVSRGIAVLIQPAIVATQGNNFVYVRKGLIRLE